MRPAGRSTTSTDKNCTNMEGNLVQFGALLANSSTSSNSSANFAQFVPRKLKLRHNSVYVFKIEMRVKAGVMKCYKTARKASAKVSVEIAPRGKDNLLPLKVIVCSKYPCGCSGDEDKRRRFNIGSKVVLRACSNQYMKKHEWKATSLASLAAASFTSPTGSGTSRQPIVTVVLNSPISQNALEP